MASFLLLIAIAEIAVAAYVTTRMMKRVPMLPVVRVVIVSIVSTMVAWMIPFEHWFGATFIAGLFEPWNVVSAIIGWLIIALPFAILFDDLIEP